MRRTSTKGMLSWREMVVVGALLALAGSGSFCPKVALAQLAHDAYTDFDGCGSSHQAVLRIGGFPALLSPTRRPAPALGRWPSSITSARH